jgi:thioredoxin-like negative regulator of GroEL
MSQTKLACARELITEKQYAAARAVLETIPGDEKAGRWLAKLDQIAPVRVVHPVAVETRSEPVAARRVTATGDARHAGGGSIA